MSYNVMENANQYKVGIYIRLSKEDEEKTEYKESESVSNQRNLLMQYLEQNNLKLEEEYVDDGVSGTSFDRPAFNRLIKDIENNRINMVITKDLSRLGRDYIMSGYYTEQYFPEHRVRYIALLDNIDTYLDSSNNDIAPFKSILNDMYAKDISKKIKSVLRNKKEMGLFVGKEAPYGYMKDPNNKYQLVIDEPAAMIVREIYEHYLQGMGTTQIANDLSSRGIAIPSVYKQTNRGNRSLKYGLWSNRTVKHILENETYTGCLIQNRYNKLNYKSKKTITTSKEKWIKVEDTQEAIIDKEIWERVQTLLVRNNNSRIRRYDYILSGLLRCYECKSAIGISKKDDRGYSYGRCQRYVKYSKFEVCTPHSFNYQKLEKKVIDLLRKICTAYTDKSNLEAIAQNGNKVSIESTLKQKIDYYINMEDKNNRKLDRLYEDRLDGIITIEDFKRMSDKIIKERDNFIATRKDYETKLLEHKEKIKNSNADKLEKLIDEFLSMKYPTKEIMGQFIEKIEVHQDKQIDIYFKFQPFNDILDKNIYAK